MKLYKFTLKAPYPTDLNTIFVQATNMAKAISGFEATYSKLTYSCVEEISNYPLLVAK